MSYDNSDDFVQTKDLRILDLAYLHYRYGVNQETRSTDDTYRFATINTTKSDLDAYIWDGAGIDTYEPDFIQGVSFIGYNTQLENLSGSAHDDILIGNNANNHIYGGNGDDEISGGHGDDYLDGGIGDDTLIGGDGNDIYIIDNQNDKITENANEGDNDTVYSSANRFTLSEHIENLHLMGDAVVGIGNTANNTIYTNSQSNTLTGNGGADKFIFNTPLNGNVDTITDFSNDDKLVLAKDIFIGLTDSMENLFKHIVYNQDTGMVSFDEDASGEKDAVDFVQLTNFNGKLEIQNFELI